MNVVEKQILQFDLEQTFSRFESTFAEIKQLWFETEGLINIASTCDYIDDLNWTEIWDKTEVISQVINEEDDNLPNIKTFFDGLIDSLDYHEMEYQTYLSAMVNADEKTNMFISISEFLMNANDVIRTRINEF